MFTKIAASVLFATGGLFAAAGTSPTSPACCLDNAKCCSTREACCLPAKALPACCVEQADCCTAKEECCPVDLDSQISS